MTATANGEIHCLITDWGGVLTEPTSVPVSRWLDAKGVDPSVFSELLREWGEFVDRGAPATPVQQIERGQISVAEFETIVAQELTRRTGIEYPDTGLLDGMWHSLAHDLAMQDVVRRARQAGVRVVLLSNSWGEAYKRESWAELFDATVVSGEVGMRKPDPEIYHLALELSGRPAHECLFVDDMLINVRTAESLGMTAVHHRDHATTAPQIERIFASYFA